MSEWPERPRRYGNALGCLLCPTMVQPCVQGSMAKGYADHLQVVHGISSAGERLRIYRAANNINGRRSSSSVVAVTSGPPQLLRLKWDPIGNDGPVVS